MIALDARLATSFTAGLLAVMNPCGFVLLPTYLVYFLGMDPRIKTRAFKFANRGHSGSPVAVPVYLVCFKDKTT